MSDRNGTTQFAISPLKRRTMLRGAVAGIALMAFGGGLVRQANAQEATPKKGGTLNMAYTSGTVRESLDPARASMGNDTIYCAHIYDRLIRLENGFTISNQLAENYSSNEAGSAWTFVLREGLSFSDGTPLTTADVAYSFARVLDPATASPSQASLAQTLDPQGIQVVDDRTITFNLKEPNSQFPLQIATRNFAIVKKGTSEFTVETAIGSGPFRLTSFAPGESWEMVRNEHYWRPNLPYLDGIRQVNIVESATLIQSLLSGNSNVIGQVGPAQAQLIEASDKAHVAVSENSAFMYVVMDLTQAPFDDPLVVRAIKLAVDRQALLNVVFQGYGTLTSDVHIWPGHPTYPENLGIRAQDLAQAKALLEEAGHPNGIELELFTSPSLSGMVELATAFAEIVRPAGINVTIRQENAGTYWSQIWQVKPMYVSYSQARPPVTMLSNLYATKPAFAETKLNNPEIDRILGDVRTSLDVDKQNALLRKAWQIVADESGSSVAFSLNVLWGMSNNIRDVRTHSGDNLQFHDAYFV